MGEWLSDGRVVTGLFSAGAILVVAISGGLIALGRFIGSTSKEVNNLGETAERDRSAFNRVAEGIKKDIDVIREDIKKILSRLPSTTPLVESGSPLRLTEFGEKISASIRAESWAEELAPELLDEVKGKEPFEVDEYCQKYVIERLSKEWERRVARCAYEFGTDQDGIKKVMAVVLRDKLLSFR